MVPTNSSNYSGKPQPVLINNYSTTQNPTPVSENTPEKSLTVLYAVIAAIVALGLAVVAVIPGAALVGPLAIVVGLSAVTLAILSLREIL